jgi:hypothetical protein
MMSTVKHLVFQPASIIIDLVKTIEIGMNTESIESL